MYEIADIAEPQIYPMMQMIADARVGTAPIPCASSASESSIRRDDRHGGLYGK
jgi:hypothetical protein